MKKEELREELKKVLESETVKQIDKIIFGFGFEDSTSFVLPENIECPFCKQILDASSKIDIFNDTFGCKNGCPFEYGSWCGHDYRLLTFDKIKLYISETLWRISTTGARFSELADGTDVERWNLSDINLVEQEAKAIALFS